MYTDFKIMFQNEKEMHISLLPVNFYLRHKKKKLSLFKIEI